MQRPAVLVKPENGKQGAVAVVVPCEVAVPVYLDEVLASVDEPERKAVGAVDVLNAAGRVDRRALAADGCGYAAGGFGKRDLCVLLVKVYQPDGIANAFKVELEDRCAEGFAVG